MKIKLKNFITPSLPLTSLYIILIIGLWAVAFLGDYLFLGSSFSEISLQIDAIHFNLLFDNLYSLLLTILNAILISHLVSRFGIINTRTFLPFLIYFFLIAAWEPTHALYKVHGSLTLFILALFQFLTMYHNPEEVEKAFLGSLFIGISSLVINELIFIIPLCWLGFVLFQSFSLRTFLASVLGLLCPWIIYMGVCYFIFPEINFHELFNYSFQWGFNLDELSLGSIIYIAILILILVSCVTGIYIDFHSNANTVRKSFNFILTLLIFFTLISFVQEHLSPTFLPFIALCYSILAAHPFTTKKSNFFGALFIIFCCINLLYIIYSFIF